jgi:hypothetical protein
MPDLMSTIKSLDPSSSFPFYEENRRAVVLHSPLRVIFSKLSREAYWKVLLIESEETA